MTFQQNLSDGQKLPNSVPVQDDSMTALVSTKLALWWPDSRLVSIQMWEHGESTLYWTTDLCLSVDKLKKEKKKNNVCVQRSVSTWCTFCQLFKLRTLTSLLDWKRCSQALSRHSSLVPPRIWSPIFLASDCVPGPSRCFVKRSAVLSFVLTRPTDRRFSLIHCCLVKLRISIFWEIKVVRFDRLTVLDSTDRGA